MLHLSVSLSLSLSLSLSPSLAFVLGSLQRVTTVAGILSTSACFYGQESVKSYIINGTVVLRADR